MNFSELGRDTVSTEKTLLSDSYRARKVEGMEEGRTDKALEIARNLLVQGVDIKTIATATGLSETDVQKLK